MADYGTKISQLTETAILSDGDVFPVVHTMQTSKVKFSTIATFVGRTITPSSIGAISDDEKGVAEGVATLDENGTIPLEQLPATSMSADDVTYDNTSSGLSGSNVQDAIDELETEKQDTLTFDSAPTRNSSNPVTSGGVYAAILALLPTDTASGSPANFPDGADGAPVVDLTAKIALTQPGSGLPSQENVRPISTFTGLTLSHSGADTSNPDTLTVSWQTEAGAIIAGTLDVTTGVLSITHVDCSAEVWANSSWNTTTSVYVQAVFVLQNPQNFSDSFVWSNRFSTDYVSGVANRMSLVTSGSLKRLFYNIPISELSDTTTEAIRTWLAANHVQFVFQYVTPVTVQLTPQDVLTLLGENNIWADTGAITVEYRADLRLYIDKRLAPSLGTQSLSAAPGLLRTGIGMEPQSLGLDEGETASAEVEAEND